MKREEIPVRAKCLADCSYPEIIDELKTRFNAERELKNTAIDVIVRHDLEADFRATVKARSSRNF